MDPDAIEIGGAESISSLLEWSTLVTKTWLQSGHGLQGEHSACESSSLLFTFVINIVAFLLFVFYLTLLLSQPMIFNFCASNSPLSPAGDGGVSGAQF